MAAIVINNLFKTFGETEVLKNINLKIPESEFCVLVGPSGCGKSTLLRMIAGLEEIKQGSIEIGGTVVNNLRPGDRNVAMVFQSYALYPHKTVEENLGFSLKMHRIKKPIIEQKISWAAQTLRLEKLLKRFPGQLSGGQRQRVAMGRAMVRDPCVFLFDEPLSNLDAKLRVQMRTEISELHQRLDVTSVYVTHDQIEAMTMADRIVVMNHGVIEQTGHPLELYDDPQNIFVATFLGSPPINILEGQILRKKDKLVVEIFNGNSITIDDISAIHENKKVKLGIRPHHLIIDPSRSKLCAEIMVVEPTGVETYLFCSINEVEVCCQVSREKSMKVGETIHLSPSPDKILIFDEKTGERLY